MAFNLPVSSRSARARTKIRLRNRCRFGHEKRRSLIPRIRPKYSKAAMDVRPHLKRYTKEHLKPLDQGVTYDYQNVFLQPQIHQQAPGQEDPRLRWLIGMGFGVVKGAIENGATVIISSSSPANLVNAIDWLKTACSIKEGQITTATLDASNLDGSKQTFKPC